MLACCALGAALLHPLTASGAGSAWISGAVSSTSRTPLAGITVKLWVMSLDGSWQVQATTTSMYNGAYAFGGLLSAKTFAVEFVDPAGAYAPEFYDDVSGGTAAGATHITLLPGEDRDRVDGSLARAGRVTGRVRDSAGQPVPGVIVDAYRHLGGTSFALTRTGGATTGSDGTYSIAGLGEASYGVKFFDPTGRCGEQYWSTAETAGVTARANATPLPVTAGAAATGIDATMLRWGAIAGTVRGASGPLDAVVVQALRGEGPSWAPQNILEGTRSGADGRFATARRAYPGRYRVRFTVGGYPEQYHRTARFIEYAADVIVPEDATATLDTMLLAADTVPPVSTAAPLPSGWAGDDVVASLSATDGVGGSGVGAILWSLDSAPSTTYAAPVTIGDEGVHDLHFRAIDGFGNAEPTNTVTVRIDKTPPVTSCDASSAYAHAATITLSAADALSGVGETRHRLDGGAWTAGPVVGVSAPGEHSLEYCSVDRAGNLEAARTATFAVTARYDDTSSGIAYRGSWVTHASHKDWGGTMRYAMSGVATATFSIRGVGFDWIAYKSYGYGIGAVWVDGVKLAEVDLYAPRAAYRQRVYSLRGLADTTHTVVIARTGQLGAGGGASISLDAVDVVGELLADRTPPVTVSDAQPGYLSTAAITLTATDFDTGVAATRYRLDSGAWATGTVVTVPFSPGSHTLQFYSVDAAGNTEATRSAGFDMLARYDSVDPGIAYTGNWVTHTSAYCWGGSMWYAMSGVATATFTIDGTGFDWIAYRSYGYGYGAVWVDGVKVADADLYAPRAAYRQRVCSLRGLPDATHTVAIARTGQIGAGGGASISLDAIDVVGSLR